MGRPGVDETLIELLQSLPGAGAERIKWERKIRVVRLSVRLGQRRRVVYVKQFNALSLRHRLASLFGASPARRALLGARALMQAGFSTARPIAALDHRRWSLLIKSFYLTEEIAGAKTVLDHWREDLRPLAGRQGRLKRRAILWELAQLFKSLHAKRIYHNDLKASNILARRSGRTAEGIFSLIDLQGVRKCRYLSRRRRVKNLAQLHRTLGDELRRSEKLYFLKTYLGEEPFARKRTRHFIRAVLKETARQVVREQMRHPSGGDEPLREPTPHRAMRRAAAEKDRTAAWR